MSISGDANRLKNYEWNEDYDDWINRFEQVVDITKIKNADELYDELHNWLGVTKKGRLLPTQTQMNFFSEFYGVEHFPVSEYISQVYEKEEQIGPSYRYRSGTYYNEATSGVNFHNRRKDIYEYYTGEEITVNMMWTNREGYTKYRRVIMIRDVKSKKILAWHKDLTQDKYFGEVV